MIFGVGEWQGNDVMKVFALAAVSSLAVIGTVYGDPVGYVDPFVGTSWNGHCFPGACRPFGLVQASPDTGNGNWHYCGGYRNEDRSIWGFSQTHVNGTGRVALGDLQIQPFREAETEKAFTAAGVFRPIPSSFRKETETAEPGYYAVTLDDARVRAEVTATAHVGFYRFTYAGAGAKRLLVDPAWTLTTTNNAVKNFTRILGGETHLDGRAGLCGRVWRDNWCNAPYSFSIAFSRPFARVEKLPPVRRDNALPRYAFDFDLPDGEPLLVKVALSGLGHPEDARRNAAAEIPDWDFDGVRAAARAEWVELLGRVSAEGDADTLRSLYTALYHLFVQPNDLADAGERPFYSTLSLWDTFRAAHPLYTILAPERVPDFVETLMRQYRAQGFLPIWTLWGWDGQDMIGTHSVPVLVDACLKGLCGDGALAVAPQARRQMQEDAYAAVKDTLTRHHARRWIEEWDWLDRHGYVPFDLLEQERGRKYPGLYPGYGAVSRTFECAYDDACAARLAERLGKTEDAAFFRRRSEGWKNLIDPETGFARARDSKGAWRTPFNPARYGEDYTEGNAMQFTFHVMQDVDGLIAACGGKEAFVRKLDAIFAAPDDQYRPADATGLIGQYAHGNEPSHHIAYLYALAGRPDRTAEIVREVFDRLHRPKPDGLCGNDDCGQMSAWYVFSAMGFYPLDPCGGEYVLGAPQVPLAKVKVGGEGEQRTFRVVAKGLSKESKYVKSATLNGRPVTDWKIRHADIMSGGELVFEMAKEPR